jgi:hypothetical protein
MTALVARRGNHNGTALPELVLPTAEMNVAGFYVRLSEGGSVIVNVDTPLESELILSRREYNSNREGPASSTPCFQSRNNALRACPHPGCITECDVGASVRLGRPLRTRGVLPLLPTTPLAVDATRPRRRVPLRV